MWPRYSHLTCLIVHGAVFAVLLKLPQTSEVFRVSSIVAPSIRGLPAHHLSSLQFLFGSATCSQHTPDFAVWRRIRCRSRRCRVEATIRIHGCIASRAVLSGVCLWQLERTSPLLTPDLARRTGPWTQLLLLGWNWEALAHPQRNWHCRMDSRAGKLGMTCMAAEVRLVRSLRAATVIEPRRARSMADRVQQTWGIRPACHREAMHIETSPQNLSDLRWFVVCQEERR